MRPLMYELQLAWSITHTRSARRSAAQLSTVTAALCLLSLVSIQVGAIPRQMRGRPLWDNEPVETQTIAIPPDPIDPSQPIQSGALIEVHVDKAPEPTGKYLVDSAGCVPVLIAGQSIPVRVKNQTAAQAAVTLTTFLKNYLKNPKVRITVIAAARPIVVVNGGVIFTGPMRINRHTTLTDVLKIARFNDYSDLSQVHLTRHQIVNGVDKPQMMILHIGTSLSATAGTAVNATHNPLLQDKDEVFVPLKNGGIAITGEVMRPTVGMLPKPKMTLAEAIISVGETTSNADRKHVSIQRGTRKIVVDLDEAKANGRPNNLVLQPGDVVHIDPAPRYSPKPQLYTGNRFAYTPVARPAAGSRQAGEAPTIVEVQIDPNQPIKPSFTINVAVDGETEPSGFYMVDPAGTILLRIADQNIPVSIKDQTAPQAAATLSTFLKKYLHDPKVTVSLIAVPRPVVTISGCVLASGPVQINRRTRLIDVINRSGFTYNSDLTHVRLTRIVAVDGVDKKTKLTLQVEDYMRPAPGKDQDETQNPLLKDGDEIFVPYKTLLSGSGGITIMGEVLHPTESMPPHPGLTLRDAISIAGGTTAIANKKTVTIKRGSLPEIIVDLNKAMQGDPANNIVLQPGDVVQVEPLSQVIRVEGGVVHAGTIPFEPGMTASKAIKIVGGPSPTAKVKACIILRWPDTGDASKTRMIKFNLDAIQKGNAKDVELQPGDAIFVPSGNLPPNSLSGVMQQFHNTPAWVDRAYPPGYPF